MSPRKSHSDLLLAALLVAVACGTPSGTPPQPTARVTDVPGVLSAPLRQELEARLAVHEQATGQQVLLWIGRSAGGTSIEDFAARAFAAWRVGRGGLDNGVVIFALTDDRRLRIEVGYGLESRLTDVAASRVLHEQMLPRIQRGDWDGAARAGVSGVLQTLGDPAADRSPAVSAPPSPVWPQAILYVVAGLALLLLFIWRPSLALHLLITVMGGGFRRDRGGGGGSVGGFRGGGGRSGGGGASGRW